MKRVLTIVIYTLLVPASATLLMVVICLPYYIADQVFGVSSLWGLLFWFVLAGLGLGIMTAE